MPNTNMSVALPLGGLGARLNVEDSTGQNDIAPNAQATTITWTLTGALAQADFVPMTAAEPGFAWLSPAPKPAIFPGTPVIGDGGNTLSITDLHTGAGSAGQWSYVLRVIYNGVVYATTNRLTKKPGETINRPVIINR